MPIARRRALRCVTSRPSMRIVPSVGVSKPAIMRSVVVLPQPLGPEEGHELAALDREVEVLDHGLGAEGLLDAGQSEKRHRGRPSAWRRRPERRRRACMSPRQAQVRAKAMTASADGS